MATTNEVRTNLGHVSAYAVAKAHGFNGTEAEWEQYIANAGTYGQQAEAAKIAAQTAQGLAEDAQAAAEAAQQAAEDARDQVGADMENKVDKVAGKGLSSNDYTTTEKTKLAGIEEGAQRNVQPNWALESGAGAIQNKPQNLVQDPEYVHTDNNYSDEEKAKLAGVEAGAKVNVQSDWNAKSGDAYIKNKPDHLVSDAEYVHTDNNFSDVYISAIQNKVDKVEGKGLSAHDLTDALLAKLNGIEQQANKTVVDDELLPASANPVQNQVVKAALDDKVDKVSGKGLSTEDFTSAEKQKLAAIEAGATAITVDEQITENSENPVQAQAIYEALGDKVDKVDGKRLSTEDYTSEEKNKLAGIAAGAEVNVNADWEASDGDAVILHKPQNLVQDASYVHTDNNYTTEEKNKLSGIAPGATAVTVDASITSDGDNPVEGQAIHAALAGKVDKETGMGLSANNFTDTLKEKLDGIEAQANKTTVDAVLASGSANPVQNQVVKAALDSKLDLEDAYVVDERSTKKYKVTKTVEGGFLVEHYEEVVEE